MLQNRSILKKHSRRLKQTLVVFLTFLLVFSGLVPSTFSQGLSTNSTVHAEEGTATNNTATQEKKKTLTYKFDKFSKDTINQLFSVNYDAEVPEGANFIRLTPPSPMKCGAVFNKTKICPKNNYSFSTAFSFKMSNKNPAGASDGLTFTIQGGTSSLPIEGGSIGYYNIKPSFTVKYDTFQNTVYSDPSSNYIGIAENGGLVNQPGWYTDLNQYNTNNGTNYALSNGTRYYTWIDYDGLSRNVQVLLGTSPDRASAKKVLDVGNIDLGTIFNGQPYYAGFTAATGYPNYETHDIYNWYFVNDYVPIETLNPNNDYKQAPSSVKLTTGLTDKPGVYDVTAVLQDPLGNPVADASLDTLTSTDGELTGPNGEPVTDLVSDADGKIHAVLKNFDHSKDVTVSATVGCASDSKTIPASNQPPTAPDDEKTVPVNTTVSGQIKGTDPDGDNLTYYAGKQPSHGTVVVNDDGTWNYTPSKDYVGDDSFTIIVDDGHGGTTESTITIHVTPTPVLESKKEASIQQKAEGNKDATHPEVGDTLLYTIQTRNTISDTPVKNAVIEDQLPEGLEYVPGTLQVDGKAATDAEGDDNGQYVQGKVTGKLGDITDTEWHTVVFHAKVKADQAGKEIQNTAKVTGDGVPPQEPTTTVEVSTPETSTPPANSCGHLSRVALVNGSFEEGPEKGTFFEEPDLYNTIMFRESEVPGWSTTDDSQGGKIIEIWNYKLLYPSIVRDFPTPPDGDRFAELNAFDNGMLYQDVKTSPGQTLYWRLSHLGRLGVDTMQVRIGAATNNPYDTVVQQQMSDGNTAWGTYAGTYKVPEGQTVTRFGFEAVSATGGSPSAGNFLDNIFLGTEPCVSATKSVSPEGQVKSGDELTYNVTVKNDGGDIAANSVFTDAIPAGTEYVPGSIQVIKNGQASTVTDGKDTDSGDYLDGKVTVNLGDLPNTDILPDGITVQFKVKVLSGYVNQQIKNKAQVAYKNLLVNKDASVETNEVVNDVSAKEAKVESEKTAKNLQDKPIAVGDEIEYTIKMRNTISDSLVKNAVIEDQLPEGLEYVSGTLQVDGKAATDAEGDDSGQYVQGKVTGKLGDITDTEWHTVVFHAKVKADQAGKSIQNTANVTGEGVPPQEPTTTVEVSTPEPPQNSCGPLERAALINGSFEEGPARGSYDNINQPYMFLESEVPGWLTTDKSQGVKLIEIWDYKQGYPGVVKDFPTPPDGNRYAEINAGENGMLYQDVKTTPGQTIYWRFSHKGREGIDKMQLRIGPSTNNPYDTVVQQQMSDGNTAWGTYTGTYKVPEGQTVTRFGFEAVSTSNGSMGYGNHIDDIFLGTEPCLSATKSVDPEGQVQTGDELTYNVTVKNNGGDVAANSIFTDAIPEGTEYVPGSIQVTKNAQVSKITDDKDTDSGYYQDGKVTVDLGDVPNTDILPEGITVQFKVKVLPGYINQQIKNKAQVAYKNLLTNRDGLVETNEVVNDVVAKAAKVESQKTAKNLQDKPIEVGDEIEYTIQTRNTISDSIVKNVVMEDQLPEGLEYVPGTLHVDGTAVTDAEGDDNGQYVQGKVTGKLGDITDTEWHTVVFHAKVKDGQAGKNIQNTANVTGDGITPQEPTTEITVQALGQIEIEKVDAADSNVKLKNAVFQILDKDGKEVGKLTTDENGKATSDPLRFGTYTLKEIQAPTGYMLLKDPVEVKVSSPVQKIKVENTKNGWDIPNTGGIGTTLFYLIGTLLMVATLIVFFRKRRNI